MVKMFFFKNQRAAEHLIVKSMPGANIKEWDTVQSLGQCYHPCVNRKEDRRLQVVTGGGSQ